MRVFSIITIIVVAAITSSCGGNATEEISLTDQVCNCLKKAANTYMVKGERASENDLKTMCSQFDGKLKEVDIDDKRKISECIDLVKEQIEDKVLFTDVEEIALPPLDCDKGLSDEMDKVQKMKISKASKAEALLYTLKNRDLDCQIVVGDVRKKPYLSAFAEDIPKNYLVKDGNIIVNGYLSEDNKVQKIRISLLIPESEKNKIIQSELIGSPLDPIKGFKYNQVISFNGNVNRIMKDGLGRLIPEFKVNSYKINSIKTTDNNDSNNSGSSSIMTLVNSYDADGTPVLVFQKENGEQITFESISDNVISQYMTEDEYGGLNIKNNLLNKKFTVKHELKTIISAEAIENGMSEGYEGEHLLNMELVK